MGNLTTSEIEAFLHQFGKQQPISTKIYLLGGSALCFLGSPRRTVDIDYTIPDFQSEESPICLLIESIADKMRLELEVVPIEEFIPLPSGSESRHKFLGNYGRITAYIYDPYTIALSKLARGFESDL